MTKPDQHNLIILNLDGLGARFLGPYGNTWLETPAINHFVSEGMLFENAFSETTVPGQSLRSMLLGHFAAERNLTVETTSRLFSNFSDAVLIGDTDLSEMGNVADFFDTRIEIPPENESRVENWSDTHLATLFATLSSGLTDIKSPFLACINSSSLLKTWDAPYSMAEQFAMEEDPEPYEPVEPPRGCFDLEESDPDLFLSFTHAYAAQISVLDHCIAALIEMLHDQKLFDRTRLVITSSFGYPLGEHGYVGPHPESLFGEQVQIPLLVRSPETGSATRIQSIVQPFQIDLIDSFDVKDEFPIAFCFSDEAQFARSPSWSHIACRSKQLLFVKPDDRWEVNNVATLCPEILECFQKTLEEQLQHSKQNGKHSFQFDERLIIAAD